MDQPKKDKSKYNRPDTPLASTPEPISYQDKYSELKGSTQKVIEKSRASKSAESALKEAKEKQANDAMNNISKFKGPY